MAFKSKPDEDSMPQTRPPMERMLRIHSMIRSGKYPNGSSLSRELEVSTKTIQRDLEFMRDRLTLPLEYDSTKFGYYYTEEVESFPTLQISEGELFALLVAEKALQQYRGTPFENKLVAAFRKLERSLPDTVSLNLADWEQTISFRTSAEPIVNLEIMETLAEAAAARTQLKLAYRKPGARKTEERVVDPYHLANVNGDWYLFAFDHLRQAIRTFVPARIISMQPTGTKFERPAKFALEKQLRDSFGIHSKEGEFDIVIQFDDSVADYIREKRWHPSQQLTELKTGGVELKLRLGSLVEVQRWILGWGGAARVIAPKQLVDGVRAAAQRLVTSVG
ncbi:MAG TPA: WYL domain-containing protein [Candidatus Limnocylindria bacterium]|nr:WYL domain-containing protein [Candidatus Limnocylindria bacterium]